MRRLALLVWLPALLAERLREPASADAAFEADGAGGEDDASTVDMETDSDAASDGLIPNALNPAGPPPRWPPTGSGALLPGGWVDTATTRAVTRRVDAELAKLSALSARRMVEVYFPGAEAKEACEVELLRHLVRAVALDRPLPRRAAELWGFRLVHELCAWLAERPQARSMAAARGDTAWLELCPGPVRLELAERVAEKLPALAPAEAQLAPAEAQRAAGPSRAEALAEKLTAAVPAELLRDWLWRAQRALSMSLREHADEAEDVQVENVALELAHRLPDEDLARLLSSSDDVVKWNVEVLFGAALALQRRIAADFEMFEDDTLREISRKYMFETRGHMLPRGKLIERLCGRLSMLPLPIDATLAELPVPMLLVEFVRLLSAPLRQNPWLAMLRENRIFELKRICREVGGGRNCIFNTRRLLVAVIEARVEEMGGANATEFLRGALDRIAASRQEG